MSEIRYKGQDAVKRAFQQEIEKQWRILECRFSHQKAKLLVALILVINRITEWVFKHGEINPEDYLRMPIMLSLLEEFIEKGWTRVEAPTQGEVQSLVDTIVRQFQEIGRLKNRMIESRAFQEEELVLRAGEKLCDVASKTEDAFGEWSAARTSQDMEWSEYYYDKASLELAQVFKNEFRAKYGVTPQQLHRFAEFLSQSARGQVRGNETEFVGIPRDLVVSKMLEIMGRAGSAERTGQAENSRVESLLSLMEYVPRRPPWFLSPFLTLKEQRREIYVPLLPVVYDPNLLVSAWMEEALRRSSTQGMRGRDYGQLFERYVRDILNKNPHLDVNPGPLRLRRKKYPRIAECVRGSDIEFEVVARSKTHCYLISCKAEDQALSANLVLSFFLSDYRTFFTDIEKDLKRAHEISAWTECVRNYPEVLSDLGLENKVLVPMLVTPDIRPLSLESVRKWVVDKMIDKSIPEAYIVQAKQLDGFGFT